MRHSALLVVRCFVLALLCRALPAWGALPEETAPTEPNVVIRLEAVSDQIPIFPGQLTQIFRYRGSVELGPPGVLDSIPGSFLGPTLHLRQHDRVRIIFTNLIDSPTTVHWHGMIVPDVADGHPRFPVHTGQEYVYEFTVLNRAGTYWYHPHPHGFTGPQVYYGLAGLLLVSDPEEEALPLPRGEYDVPVVVQDRSFDEFNQFQFYTDSMHAGFFGNKIMVNGMLEPSLSTATRAHRFRVLNGSVSRIYKLAWSDGSPVTVIGTDGGLLEAPVTRPYVMLAPAERVEIWRDLSGIPVGSDVVLRSLAFDPGGMHVASDLLNGAPFDILTLHVDRAETETLRLPEHLTNIERFRIEDAVRPSAPRSFAASFDNGQWLLNGLPFEMDGVARNEIVRLGDLEAWEFTNTSSKHKTPHPIHVHGVQFQVYQRTMSAPGALAYGSMSEGFVDSGWKDTVLVPAGGTVRLLVRFLPYPGLFLYHCHNLAHEDIGMMRNFLIQESGEPAPPREPAPSMSVQVPAVWSGPQPLSISFDAETADGPVTARIFSVTGREVRTLDGGGAPHAEHGLSWDLRESDGVRAAAGVYLIRLTTGQSATTRRFVLLH